MTGADIVYADECGTFCRGSLAKLVSIEALAQARSALLKRSHILSLSCPKTKHIGVKSVVTVSPDPKLHGFASTHAARLRNAYFVGTAQDQGMGGTIKGTHKWQSRFLTLSGKTRSATATEFPSACHRVGDWYNGTNKPAGGYMRAAVGFTAVNGWAQVYQEAGAPAYTDRNAKVEVRMQDLMFTLKSNGRVGIVQDRQKLESTEDISS